MTFLQFMAKCQTKQRQYLNRETKRLAKAVKLWRRYDAAMKELGLHPLTRNELTDRAHELSTMRDNIAVTYGDTPGMRAAYHMRQETTP